MDTLLALFGAGLIGFAVAAVLSYFVPALIAAVNRHPHMLGVILLNLLLGWTGFGWAAALVWAVVPLTNRENRGHGSSTPAVGDSDSA